MNRSYLFPAVIFGLLLVAQSASAAVDRQLRAFEDEGYSTQNLFFRTGVTIYVQSLGTAQAPDPVLYVRLGGIQIEVDLIETPPRSGIYRCSFRTGYTTSDENDIIATHHSAILQLRSDIDRDGVEGTTDVLNITIDDQAPQPPRWCDSNATPYGSIRVNWTEYAGSDFRRYTVVRSLNQDMSGYLQVANISDPKTLQWFDPESNLISGVAYWYGVKVVDLAGNPSMIRTAERCVVPFNDTTPPSRVKGLVARAPAGGNSINLTWQPNPEADVVGYNIYHDTTPQFPTSNARLIGFTTQTTFLHEGISANYVHFYVVVAFDEEENRAAPTAPVNATPHDTIAPGAPKNLAIVTDPTGYLNLSWTAPEGEEVYLYRIYRSEESGAQQFWNPIATTSLTRYLDKGVENGRTYFYVVRSADRAGNEERNVLQVAATSVDGTPPGPPRALNAKDTEVGKMVTLVWLNPGGEIPVEYRVYRSTTSRGQNFSDPLASVSKTSFTDRSVQDGIIYYYVVRSVDAAGNEDSNTDEIAVVSRDLTPPGPVVEVVAFPRQDGIGIGWLPPGSNVEDPVLSRQMRADVDHYNVYWNTYEGFKPDPSRMISTTDTYVVHRDVVDGETYYYVVRAVDAAGNENKDDARTSASAVADISPPGPPANLRTYRLEDGRVMLDWDAPAGEAPYRYNIYRSGSPNSQSFRVPFAQVFDKTEWIDENVSHGNRYYYVVRSADFLLNEEKNTMEVWNVSEDRMPPGPPTGLQVKQLPMGDLMVNWTKPEPLTTSLRAREADLAVLYRVYSSTTPGGQNFSRPIAETTLTYIIDKGLRDGTTYYYVVRAVDSAGNEDDNRFEVKGVADASPPPAPSEVVAQRTLKGEVILTWSDPKGEEVFEYRIYKFEGDQIQDFRQPLVVTRKNVFVDNDVPKAIQYRYVIRSVDKAGNEGRNTEEILAPILLGPPLNVLARASKGGAIDLSWQPPAGGTEGIKEYNIYRSLVPGSDQIGSPWATTILTSFKDTTRTVGGVTHYMIDGTRYYYYVRAVDAYENEGLKSQEVSAVSDNTPPEKPRDLVAIAQMNGDILLRWGTPFGERVVNYRIYRSTRSGVYNYMVPTAETTRIQHYDTGLESGRTYYYVVRAIDEAGNEEQNTNEVSAIAFDYPPNPPTGLRAQVRPNGSITLLWNAPQGEAISYYNLYRSLESRKFNFAEPYARSTLAIFTDTFVENGQTYYYVVRAVDSTGNEEKNENEISATSLDTEPPGAPVNLTAWAYGTGKIRLEWKPPKGEAPANYLIYRSQSPYFKPGNQYYLNRTKATFFVDPNLGDAQTYYYVVRSIDAIGNEDQNENRVSATTPPAPPLELRASSNEKGEIILTWKIPATPVSHFRIYRAKAAVQFDYSNPIEEVGYPSSTYTDSGLNHSQTYYYIVRSVDSLGGEESNANQVSAISLETIPPDPPIDLIARSMPTGALSLTWSHPNPSDVSVYSVYRSEGSPSLARLTLLAKRNVTYLEDDGVVSGRTYYYIVRATDPNGNEEQNQNWTSVMSLDITPPESPTDLSAKSVSGGSIELAWNPPLEKNLTYVIYRATRPDPANATIVGQTNLTTFLDTGLVNGMEYFYIVRARDPAGNEEDNETMVSALATKGGPRIILALGLVAVFFMGAYVVDRQQRAGRASTGQRG